MYFHIRPNEKFALPSLPWFPHSSQTFKSISYTQNPCNELLSYQTITMVTMNTNLFTPLIKYGSPDSDLHETCAMAFSKSLLCRISSKVNTILERKKKKLKKNLICFLKWSKVFTVSNFTKPLTAEQHHMAVYTKFHPYRLINM